MQSANNSSPIQVAGSEVCKHRLLHLFSHMQQHRHLGNSLWPRQLLHSLTKGQQLAPSYRQPIYSFTNRQQSVWATPPYLTTTHESWNSRMPPIPMAMLRTLHRVWCSVLCLHLYTTVTSKLSNTMTALVLSNASCIASKRSSQPVITCDY